MITTPTILAERFNLASPEAIRLFARDNDGVGPMRSVPAIPIADGLNQIAGGAARPNLPRDQRRLRSRIL